MNLNPVAETIQSDAQSGVAIPTNLLLIHEENKLIAAAANGGSAAAFENLWSLHSKKIFRLTHRITKNREDAEDALQDAFLNAFVHLSSFDGRSSFSTWLTRIAINSSLMLLRKKRNAAEISIDEPAASGSESEFVNLEDKAPNPEDLYAQLEQQARLHNSIRALKPTIRRAVELQKLEERSLKETAKLMGLSVVAAKSRLQYAKAAIRKSLRARPLRQIATRQLRRAA
jgi:RNA polymerase sigma factor (sigma-70 family)